jgi:CRISPR/Cas system-associated endonuclease Cas1
VALRRAQYTAPEATVVAVCLWLVAEKVKGQRELLAQVMKDQAAVAKLDSLVEYVDTWCGRVDEIRQPEGQAGAIYFGTLEGLPLKWRKADAKRVPPH